MYLDCKLHFILYQRYIDEPHNEMSLDDNMHYILCREHIRNWVLPIYSNLIRSQYRKWYMNYVTFTSLSIMLNNSNVHLVWIYPNQVLFWTKYGSFWALLYDIMKQAGKGYTMFVPYTLTLCLLNYLADFDKIVQGNWLESLKFGFNSGLL